MGPPMERIAPLTVFAALTSERIEDEKIDLARAALAIARLEYPELDVERYCGQLDAMGQRVARLIGSPLAESGEIIRALNRVLFEEERFGGNRDDYYDPRNSFLNDVLERRVGIPITLSVVYMEVARRVGFPLFGVGMPGHFLLKYFDPDGREMLLDAFERGRALSTLDCQRRLDEIYSGQMAMRPEFLLTVGKRQILTRMLNNLRQIYMTARNFRKALPVVDMILAIYPRSPEDVKQRALLRYALGQHGPALQDLEDYLKMSPEASDADEIRQTTISIRRTLATMN